MKVPLLDPEFSLLGTCLNNPVNLDLVRPIVAGRHFADSRARVVFEALIRLADRGEVPNELAVRDDLRQRGDIPRRIKEEEFNDILAFPCDTNAEIYARRIILRRAREHLRQIASGTGPDLDVLEFAAQIAQFLGAA